jgi:vacuolar-type H+-ATPase subunit F/Vma7
MKDVIEVTRESSAHEFQKAMGAGRFSLVVASQSVRKSLTDAQRAAAESSLSPLVVFVPGTTGEYEVESVEALAKRVLGVTLAMPK